MDGNEIGMEDFFNRSENVEVRCKEGLGGKKASVLALVPSDLPC